MNLLILITIFLNFRIDRVNSKYEQTITYGHAGFFLQRIKNTELFSNHWLHTIHIKRPIFNFEYPAKEIPRENLEIIITLMNSYKLLFNEDPHHISKRALFDHGLLPFIGWIQSKLIGVATLSDLDDIKVSSQSLTDYIEKLKDAVKDHSTILEKMLGKITETDRLTEEIAEKQNLLIREFENYSESFNELKSQFHLNEKFHRNFERFTTFLNFYVHNYLNSKIVYSRILSDCQKGYLSRELINKYELKNLLLNLTEEIKDYNLTLSIQLENLEYYYEIDICHCISREDRIEVVISFPITQKELVSYEIFSIKTIPIMLDNKTYTLEGIHNGLLVVSNDEVHSILEYKSYCLSSVSFNLEGCLIHPVLLRSESPKSCLRNLVKGGSLKEYKEKCKLIPRPEMLGEWIQINSSSWIYSGVEKNVSIRCGKKIDIWKIGGSSSSVIISLPCNCLLNDFQNKLIVSPTSMCSEVEETNIIDLTSFFALPSNFMIFKQPTIISDLKINKNLVPIKIGNITNNFISDKAELKRIQKFLSETSVPKIDWTSSYTSWWGWIINICIIVIVLIILFCSVKSFLQSKLGKVSLLSFLPQARAEGGYILLTSIDLITLIIIGILLYIIIRMISRIIKKFRCHHIKTKVLSSNPSHHIDIVTEINGELLIIGICDIPLPPSAYNMQTRIGQINLENGLLTLKNFTILKYEDNFTLDINSTYKIASKIKLINANAYVKMSKDISNMV